MFPWDFTELEELNLDESEKEVLRQQQISMEAPGTILKDFTMLLSFIADLGDKGVQVSRNQNFLPMKYLAELNSRLAHPVEINLKRPQQKAFPHLHGLYLLLRASTLTYVEPSGSKFFLRLNSPVLASWEKLNPTERYFTLLQAWWIWGDLEILGQRSGFDVLEQCWMFWNHLPQTKKKQLTAINQNWYKRQLGLDQIALFEMFGLLEVQSQKGQNLSQWQLVSLKKTAFGNALLKLIILLAEQNDQLEEELNQEEEPEPFAYWLEDLQPFFPELKNYLCVPEVEAVEGVYIFNVSLGDIWRRLAIDSDYTLYDLSSLILDSFNFDDDHLHQFSFKSPYGSTVTVHHPSSHEIPITDEFEIVDLSGSVKPGQNLTYLFDFGDYWQFDVKLERVEPKTSPIQKPTLVESYGEAPQQYPH